MAYGAHGPSRNGPDTVRAKPAHHRGATGRWHESDVAFGHVGWRHDVHDVLRRSLLKHTPDLFRIAHVCKIQFISCENVAFKCI